MGARGRCLAVVLALGLLTSSSSAKGPKCFPREGHCVAVKVNGQSSVKVGKQTRKLLRDLEEVHYSVDDTRYELVTPVRGDFEILAEGGRALPGPGEGEGGRRLRDHESTSSMSLRSSVAACSSPR